MKKVLWVAVGVAALVVIYAIGMNQQKMDAMNKRNEAAMEESKAMMQAESAMMKKDEAMMENTEWVEGAMVKEGEAMVKEGEAMMKKDESAPQAMTKVEGKYAVYSETAVADALKSGQNVALFFHATWCPSCKAADSALSSTTPPSDLVVFKTDYDTYKELKKQYGVTTQHTFVALNADGTMKKKVSGGKSFSEINSLFN